MSSFQLLSILPLVAMLVWAAITDVRVRLIRNWLTLAMVLTGLAQPMTGGGTVTFTQSLLGLLVGFAIPFCLFAIGALGGGDVKLLAGVGAWVGVLGVLRVIGLEAIIGMLLVVAQAIAEGRLALLSRNSAVLAINLVHVRSVGIDHAIETGRSTRTVDRPLPFAVPVLIAVLTLIAAGRLL